ncbi:nitroreductase family protein [Aliihoeflea sp. 40Bstr573]|uniref:nitroreductase family protein n=1 Tax=Aliihoeflea sp. 40Bstr573 TaxID=2696467 RepID=UPI0020965727|nr:nitroreductase family protein [Aliihoeflea sp. 40Bstr573]MCO6386896.1 nitroreductase family protein [Aliihoeflea sp. 40Bstr573]
MKHTPHRPLEFRHRDEAEMMARAQDFRALMKARRTVRDFSPRPVPRELIETCIMTAGGAPSGANQQPWTFVCIGDPATKTAIREAAEKEEREFYAGRASEEWLDALAPIGTDANKPFLETAPWLVAIFAQRYGLAADGKRVKHYYVPESVGIATGFLIAALHNAGLATLTHTPSPMGFLNEICGRPEHEKALILLVVGYPEDGALVPDIGKKSAGDIIVWKT